MTDKDSLLLDFCTVKKAIGYRIRKLRESKDYSQENMGGELGITAGAYAKIERGETDPSATRLLRIAEVLGVDVYTFFHDNQLRPVSSVVNQPPNAYEAISKSDIDGLAELVKKLSREMEKMKTELTELKKGNHKKHK